MWLQIFWQHYGFEELSTRSQLKRINFAKVDNTAFVIFYAFACVCAGNNFSLFTGNMSFQIFLLVGHFTNWTRYSLLTDKTLKKITQDVLVRCSVWLIIMWNWQVIFKIWSYNIHWPTVISSTACYLFPEKLDATKKTILVASKTTTYQCILTSLD